MALRKTMPIAPQTRPDPKHETTYQASRGGHFPKPDQPTPGTSKTK